MGVGVDEAGDERVTVQVDLGIRLIAPPPVRAWQHGQYASPMNRDAVIGKHLASGFHRDYPGRAQKRIDALHVGIEFLFRGLSDP
jgi:hypothetical protein